jgi:hypothetical protein
MLFTSDRVVHGKSTGQYDKPEWGPLLELAPDHIDEFMWMCEIELESGLRLHNYKHIETRKNLHLDQEGRAFVYLWSDETCGEDPGYREVDPRQIVREVLRRRTE